MSNFINNDYVLILNNHYKIEYGSVGIIKYPVSKSKSLGKRKYGVKVFDLQNSRSSYGYFWFEEESLELITEKQYNETVIKIKEAIIKERKEETNMVDSNSLGNRGMRVAEGVVTIPKNKGVVELFFERKRTAIINEFNERQKDSMENDENVLKLKALVESFNLERNTDDPYSGTDYSVYLTKETRENCNILYEDYKKDIDTLGKLKNEVNAMLSGCSTYSEELEVLKGYNIAVSTSGAGIKMDSKSSDSPFLSI